MSEEQNTGAPEVQEEVVAAQEQVVPATEEPKGLATKIKVPMEKIDRAFGSLKRQAKSFEEKRADENTQREAVRGGIEAEMKRQFKLDPIGWAKDAGYDFQQLADIQLNDGQVSDTVKHSTELELLKAEIAELREKDTYEKQTQQEFESQKAEELAISNYKQGLEEYIQGEESFELVRDHNAIEVVFDVIEQHFNDTQVLDEQGAILTPGVVLEMKEACQAVEDHLRSHEDSEWERLSKRRQPKNEENTGNQEPGATLSNEHSTISPTNSSDSGRVMSREDSLARAASLLKYNQD